MSEQSETTRHLDFLCGQIGSRPIGSAGNQRASAYIKDIFESSGYKVETQTFACPAWECSQTQLELDGDMLASAANAFSPSCDVTAPGAAVGTLAELETADLTHRIAILHGDLTKATLSPRGWFLASEWELRILELLEQKQPAAIITINPKIGSLERVIEDWSFPIPSATVPPEVGLAMLNQANPKLRLRIDSRQAPGQAANLVASKAGPNPARIVLCAHFDTKIETPGAFDNGGGTAVLLTLAQRLAKETLPIGLECIAFNGEDLGPGLGDAAYIEQRGQMLEQILTVINVDGVGQWLGATSITAIAASAELQALVAGIPRCYPGVVQVDPWPESNHSTFTFRGIPAIAISSVGGADLAHSPADTTSWINPVKLDEVVSLVTELVTALQVKPLAWSRVPAV
jgi:aminopeptidase YwaD